MRALGIHDVAYASIHRVNEGVTKNPTKWRMFADAVALALGINVWISLVVLPGFFIGGFRTPTDIAIASAPLAVLAVGIWRRSDVFLLLLFPSALMIPIALTPELVESYVYGPIRFVVVSIGVIAYLFGVSFFSSFREPPPPERERALASSRKPIPPRWRRRFRMYIWLTILSIAFPVMFFYVVNYHDENTIFLSRMFPGRVAHMTTVANLAAIGLWVFLYLYAFLGVLRLHRTGDRILVADLGRLRADAKRGRLRLPFFVGVFFAVGFMLVLILGQLF